MSQAGCGLIHALGDSMIMDLGKVNRSSVYYLITTLAYINQRREAWVDALGGVIVVGLWMGGVSLMRLVLSWAL
jgi:hypothetical protein